MATTTPVTKRARAVYREWKTQRIDEQLDDVFRLAYGRGQCDAIEPGTPVSWIVDPDGPACPDAEDNALAGIVALGRGVPDRPHLCPGPRRVPLLDRSRRPLAFAPVGARLRRPAAGEAEVSGRAILIAVGVLFLLVVVFGRALARFYIDFLWHDGLGRGDVFWGVIRAKATLFVFFFLAFATLVGVNLFIADKLAPSRFPANVHPYVERFHELFGHRLRAFRYIAAGLLSLLVALPTTSQWQSWLLFRNSRSFGVSDAQFGADVGFYVFELPFIGFVLDWLFIAMVLVLLITLLTHVLNGGVVFASPMPSVRPATKGHIAVLLAVLAALKAADYWVNRYELTNERRGFVQGATYAVVNAQLPALMLLILIALLTGGLFLATLRGMSWRLPLIASGLWLVVLVAGALVYPALVQSLVVNPNQQSREAPFITRNVLATRAAMGIPLDQVEKREVSFERLTSQDVDADLQPLRNVRLLNPPEMLSRFSIDQGQEAGLKIVDLDVDRYELDGERKQVLIAARELDVDGSPNRSWQGRHLINTHGCGLIMAPVGRVQESDRARLSGGRTRPTRALLQPQSRQLRRGEDERERAGVQ